ncbi:dynein light chain roadblock-type 1-like protein [Sarcoptes scabiei]|uniref:Dynein light chain roadblock-type 1-like protein n=1 Tax=Sarcoptes scabiei TaxID=52283 RepID=A0A132A3Y4_SARSC|nr:dynein light chain roadblock-type 1-like protein [Sarcoptes scabiei]
MVSSSVVSCQTASPQPITLWQVVCSAPSFSLRKKFKLAKNSRMIEVDELLRNIDGQFKDVVGVLIVDREGIIIKSTINEVVETIQNYGITVAQIVETSNTALKENGELQFLRMKTKKNEFIVVPGSTSNVQHTSSSFMMNM